MTIPDGIFKAYDIRGLYPQELDEAAAERIGCALAQQLGASRLGAGMDPRPSSTGLLEAFAAGAAAAGASTVDFGLVPTEMLYFGVASQGLDGGVMVTASHNPPQYNGMKLVQDGALPLSGDSGIPELKERAQALGELPARSAGAVMERLDLYPAYVEHLHRLVDVTAFRPYKVVMDAANGVAGKLAPLVFEGTALDCVEMYFEVDGTFPNHSPNPLLEENSREIRERVVAEGADLGIAWDGDADRCFFIDADGEFVPGDFVTALLAEALLLKNPGAQDPLRPARQPRRARRDHGERRRAPAQPRRARVLQAAHAPRGRAVRRRGLRPLLLRRQLQRRLRVHPGAAHPRPALAQAGDDGGAAGAAAHEVLHQRRDQLDGRGRAGGAGAHRGAVRRRRSSATSTASPSTTRTGTSTCAPSNTEPLLRLNLGADSQALMEEKRDLVLSVIREG